MSSIRKITRGVSSGNGDVTISCSITDTSKVIVLLNTDIVGYIKSSTGISLAGGAAYLKSVSNTNIIVNAKGPTNSSSNSYSTREITFSYQIIEFI